MVREKGNVMEELRIQDFSFNGRLGSQGAKIEKAGVNHFRIQLGQAPGHPEWCNLLQFEILQNAKGNKLRLDVAFDGDPKFRFNHDVSTWSYDGRNWMPIAWKYWNEPGGEKEDTLIFPEFTGDRVYLGAQVPMSYEEVVEFMEKYGQHPHAKVNIVGKSTGNRNIYRLEITDPDSSVPRSQRWGFHVNSQHCGEHHGKWRMISMIDWLLSDEGSDFRRRSVWHFVLEMNPDGPSNGWYRVSAEGVDLNRAYLSNGSDPDKQPRESFFLQKDFEGLMVSETPITACWSMHTWPDEAQPFMYPGPEVGSLIGPWTELRDMLDRMDTRGLIKPLGMDDKKLEDSICWHNGPYAQFGITNYLCEGSDYWTDKNMSLEVGCIFIQAMAQYYKGVKKQ